MIAAMGALHHRPAWIIVAAALALLVSACGTPEKIEGDNWAGPHETPGGRELTPEAAIRRGIAGWVLLQCVAGPQITAEKCFVIAETPEGWGFGAGALRGAADVKVTSAQHFAGGHIPVPGESFQLPFVFCPPTKPDCPLQTRATIAAFLPQVAAVRRALRVADCPTANRLAADTGLGGFEGLVARSCARAGQRPAPLASGPV